MIKVRTEYVPERKSSYLTPGKIYEAEYITNCLYRITDDEGERLSIIVGDSEVGCAHIGDRNWEIVNDAEQ